MAEAEKEIPSYYEHTPDIITGDEDDAIRKKVYKNPVLKRESETSLHPVPRVAWVEERKNSVSKGFPGILSHLTVVMAICALAGVGLWQGGLWEDSAVTLMRSQHKQRILQSQKEKAGFFSSFFKSEPKSQADAVKQTAPKQAQSAKVKVDDGQIKDESAARHLQKDIPALGGPVKQDITGSPLPTSVNALKRESETSSPPVLEQIRRDTKRIYLEKKVSAGDVTFTILNVSEHGIELLAENKGDSVKTYYFPKVTAEGRESTFEGTVLSPGSKYYGWLVVPNIREKKRINLEFSAVGGASRKENLKLNW